MNFLMYECTKTRGCLKKEINLSKIVPSSLAGNTIFRSLGSEFPSINTLATKKYSSYNGAFPKSLITGKLIKPAAQTSAVVSSDLRTSNVLTDKLSLSTTRTYDAFTLHVLEKI